MTVIVNSLRGATLEIYASPQTTICELKREAEQAWQIPRICQTLSVGTTVLNDAEVLASHSCNEDFIEVSLTISGEKVWASRLADSDSDSDSERVDNDSEAVALVQGLIYMARFEYERAIEALCLYTKVSYVAAMGLARVALPGDERVLSALVACLDRQGALEALAIVAQGTMSSSAIADASSFHWIRIKATEMVQVFAKMASEGDAHGITALCACLRNPDNQMIQAVRSAFSQMKCNDHCIAEMVKCSRSTRHPVMLEALGRVSHKNDSVVITVLSECLKDWNESVQSAASRGLEKVLDGSSTDALSPVCQLLEHDNECVRRAAVKTIAKVVPRGDQDSIAVLSVRLEHCDDRVRRATLEALSQITERGDQHVTAALSKCLGHRKDSVRRSAARALIQLTPKGDRYAIGVVSKHTSNSNPSVQRLAEEVLSQIAPSGTDASQRCCTHTPSSAPGPDRAKSPSRISSPGNGARGKYMERCSNSI